jgi:glutamyl-tRNA reductase
VKVQMVGCSHHNSSTDIRGRLAFGPGEVGPALQSLRDRFPGTEAVLLSTCNRVEVYTAADDDGAAPTHQQMVEFLAECHGLHADEIFDDLFQRTGEDAIRHLFTVAASLDSMVVGEPQISAQVKEAYELATGCHSTGPVTHQIFQAAQRVAKRVATETAINEKRVSIPSVAVGDFARNIFERFDDKRILVIGAGEMAEETLRYLADQGARDVTVVNRSLPRALDVAERWSGRAIRWSELEASLVAADLVVSTTGAEEPIVTLETYRRIEPLRYQRDLFILDLAVPRDFEPAIGDCLNVYLYSIDDLREACDRNRRERDKERTKALEIIEQETGRFIAELNHRASGSIIMRVKQGWQQHKDDELRRLFNKLPELSSKQQSEVRQAFDRLTNKLLHPPLESLRDEARQGGARALLEAFQRLFNLRG